MKILKEKLIQINVSKKLLMNKYFTLLLLLTGILCHAQLITFSYDAAGNQIIRKLCISGCTAKKSDTKPKEIEALVPEDMQKFFPEDVISYYPNPVKEELYLKWELIDSNTVTSIKVYNLNGQLVKSYSNLEKENAENIPFQSYPTGIYAVVLFYSNNEQKSIKIIKQ
ncbi:T9SS type A sorting domain-containing protein [Flavobacterium sp. HJJ]|uniref:T9SS type A sorting domain-containing protein n=1 Tax=Flavobacterium sp. HJJ TaxID=2783792 RepID=UPI001E3147E9|nr:T9SS type A sorting domain-containing protein [Flavobacterium sp. HJJ]